MKLDDFVQTVSVRFDDSEQTASALPVSEFEIVTSSVGVKPSWIVRVFIEENNDASNVQRLYTIRANIFHY